MKNTFLLTMALTLTSLSTWADYGNYETTSYNESQEPSYNGPRLCIDSLNDYNTTTIQDCVSSMKKQAEEEHADTRFLHGYCISTLKGKGMSTYDAESSCAYLL